MSSLRLGPREADMLMDALVALEGQWQDFDPAPSAEEHRRLQRLMDKLRLLRKD